MGADAMGAAPAPMPSAATRDASCPRCAAVNPSGMRFCRECGTRLDRPQEGLAPSLPEPRTAPVGTEEAGGPVCWRCRGVGDGGAEYCKFCGARYGDAPHDGANASASLLSGGALLPSAHLPSAPPTAPVAAPPATPADETRANRTLVDSPQVAPGEVVAQLVSILKDGTDGRVFPLYGDQIDLGREQGQLVFADDPYLSPRHARIQRRGTSYILRDLDSVNGVFIRLREPVDVVDGDMILVGQQVLRFEVLSDGELPLGPAMQHGVLLFGTPEVPRIARLVQYTTEGVGRDVHYLYRDETVLGRENGDIVFTDDPFLSRRHAALAMDRTTKRFILRDLGSSNGTAVRVRGERVLGAGDQFRVGRHLFRFDRHGSAADGGAGAR